MKERKGMKRGCIAALLLGLLPSSGVLAQETADSVRPSVWQAPTTIGARYYETRVLALDEYVDSWLKGRTSRSVALEARWDTRQMAAEGRAQDAWLPYAKDYGYPTFTLGLRYNFNHGTTMHRDAEDWGEEMEVDYTTRLGDILTLYGRFDRPLWRTRRLTAGYYLGAGVGYAFSHYDTERHIDNELIGTRANIYFTAGLYAAYRLSRHTALEAGVDFSHHSNGALYRPNKGANYLGPYVGLSYTPQPADADAMPATASADAQEEWQRHPLYLEFSAGLGAKTLSEDWQHTQFQMHPGDADYRKSNFALYGAFSLQADLMWRYARRWASGLGFDVFYGDYAEKVERWEQTYKEPQQVSPWSLGIALKHEAFFGRLSVRVGLGYYVYRHMGTNANEVEQPYYERVGLFYTLSRRSGLSVGFSVNAHRTRADFTELQVALPVYL